MNVRFNIIIISYTVISLKIFLCYSFVKKKIQTKIHFKMASLICNLSSKKLSPLLGRHFTLRVMSYTTPKQPKLAITALNIAWLSGV